MSSIAVACSISSRPQFRCESAEWVQEEANLDLDLFDDCNPLERAACYDHYYQLIQSLILRSSSRCRVAVFEVQREREKDRRQRDKSEGRDVEVGARVQGLVFDCSGFSLADKRFLK